MRWEIYDTRRLAVRYLQIRYAGDCPPVCNGENSVDNVNS